MAASAKRDGVSGEGPRAHRQGQRGGRAARARRRLGHGGAYSPQPYRLPVHARDPPARLLLLCLLAGGRCLAARSGHRRDAGRRALLPPRAAGPSAAAQVARRHRSAAIRPQRRRPERHRLGAGRQRRGLRGAAGVRRCLPLAAAPSLQRRAGGSTGVCAAAVHAGVAALLRRALPRGLARLLPTASDTFATACLLLLALARAGSATPGAAPSVLRLSRLALLHALSLLLLLRHTLPLLPAPLRLGRPHGSPPPHQPQQLDLLLPVPALRLHLLLLPRLQGLSAALPPRPPPPRPLRRAQRHRHLRHAPRRDQRRLPAHPRPPGDPLPQDASQPASSAHASGAGVTAVASITGIVAGVVAGVAAGL